MTPHMKIDETPTPWLMRRMKASLTGSVYLITEMSEIIQTFFYDLE